MALFVIDARAGLTPLDEEIARWLRQQDVPVVLVANKAEGNAGESGMLEAYSLGLGEPVACQRRARRRHGRPDSALLPLIDEKADRMQLEAEAEAAIAADAARAAAEDGEELEEIDPLRSSSRSSGAPMRASRR